MRAKGEAVRWDYTDLCPQGGLEYEQTVLIAGVLNAAEAFVANQTGTPFPDADQTMDPLDKLVMAVDSLCEFREAKT